MKTIMDNGRTVIYDLTKDTSDEEFKECLHALLYGAVEKDDYSHLMDILESDPIVIEK